MKSLVNLYSRDASGDSERIRKGATFDTSEHIGAHVPADVPGAEDWELCPCVKAQARSGGAFTARARCKSCDGIGYVRNYTRKRSRR